LDRIAAIVAEKIITFGFLRKRKFIITENCPTLPKIVIITLTPGRRGILCEPSVAFSNHFQNILPFFSENGFLCGKNRSEADYT
jgi:hypothetical protein